MWLIDKYELFHIKYNFFTKDRDFRDYLYFFGDELVRELNKLKHGSTIIEMGAGNGYFAQSLIARSHISPDEIKLRVLRADTNRNANSYYRPFGLIPEQYTGEDFVPLEESGISELNKFLSREIKDKPNIVLISYKPEREIPQFEGKIQVIKGKLFSEIKPEGLKEASLIIDVYGVISYDTNLERVLTNYFKILKKRRERFSFSSTCFY